MSRYWSSDVKSLTPYVPGEQPKTKGLIKLNTNENPYGPSPLVLSMLESQCSDSLRLYPDPDSEQLKNILSDYHGVSSCEVFVGNGSDEVLAHTFKALFRHEHPVLFPDITYSFYPVFCQLFDIDYNCVALTEDFSINLQDYLNKNQTNNGGIIFANPNAPTGLLVSVSEIRDLLQRNTGSVVVVDEAYIDFGGESVIPLIKEFPNLLVIRTFSKARSLAGLRVGYAVGDTQLIEALERVKNSFNSYPLNDFAIAGATASIKDDAYFKQTCQKVIATRERLTEQLQKLGFSVLPSKTNFVFAKPSELDAESLATELRARSIIVRYFNMPRIDQYLRISIGTDEQCEALVEALIEIC